MGSAMADLFGDPDAPVRSPREVARLKRRLAETPMGYAAPPGSGPAGETCRSCLNSTRIEASRGYWKCRLMQRHWTRSRHTDIRISAPACRAWSRDPLIRDEPSGNGDGGNGDG